LFSIFVLLFAQRSGHYQVIVEFQSNIMQEKQRIITVAIVVVIYNIIDRLFFHRGQGLTTPAVVISIVIAIVLYLALIYFFGKKHLN